MSSLQRSSVRGGDRPVREEDRAGFSDLPHGDPDYDDTVAEKLRDLPQRPPGDRGNGNGGHNGDGNGHGDGNGNGRFQVAERFRADEGDGSSRWRELFFRAGRRRYESAIRHRNRRGYHMRRVLAISDMVAVLATSGLLGAADALGYQVLPQQPFAVIPIAVVLWLLLAGIGGMYHVDEQRLDCSIADEIGQVAQLTAVWSWLLFLFDTLVTAGSTPVLPAIALWLVAVPMILSGRGLVRGLARKGEWYRQSAFVVGRDDDADRVIDLLDRHPEYGVDVTQRISLDRFAGRSRVEALIDLAEQANVDRVIFASSYEGLDERTGALRFLSEGGIKVDLVPGDSEVFRSDAELHFVEGLPFLTLPSTGRARSASLFKRVIDVGIASVCLVLASPLLAYAAIRIKLGSPGPVFFHQPRVGRGGEYFELRKFRTMAEDADGRKDEVNGLNPRTDGMFKLRQDPRVTRFGAFLRRYSIDELPQLINVLRGEMSLVGPRPLIQAESELVSDHYLARFNVRPGITGPWQVFGRSHIPFDDMLKLDYTYVLNWSIGDDVKLLVRTMAAITHGRGAY